LSALTLRGGAVSAFGGGPGWSRRWSADYEPRSAAGWGQGAQAAHGSALAEAVLALAGGARW